MWGHIVWGTVGVAALVVGVVALLVVLYTWPAAALAFVAIFTVALYAGKRRNDHDTTHHPDTRP